MLHRVLARRPRATARSLHVVERRHRDGVWLPVALAVRAKNAAAAVQAYRGCLPGELLHTLTLRARLQANCEFAGLTPAGLLAAH